MASKIKILMADDEKNILDLTGEMLRQSGYDVVTALDGTSAYEKAVAERPDLIVLDRHMPGMNGVEVCKKLQQDETLRTVPVIFLTAQDTKQEIMEGYSEGAINYITKPFNMNELLESIRNIISTRKPNNLSTQP